MKTKPLFVSTISEQWYCEKMVELSVKHPNIHMRSIDIEIGDLGHAEMEAQGELISEKEINRKIKLNEPIKLHEQMLDAKYNKWLIRGRPDFVETKGKAANLLLEFKFMKTNRVYNPMRVQLNTYGYILNQNGFNTSKMFCGIVFLPKFNPGQEDQGLNEFNMTGDVDSIVTDCKKIIGKNIERKFVDRGDYSVWLYKFPLATAKNDLKWAFEFWEKKRPAIPTSKPQKCALCPYNALKYCSDFKAKPDKSRIKIRKETQFGKTIYHFSRR